MIVLLMLISLISLVSSIPLPQATPNCNTILGRSLPECQRRSDLSYGNFGDVWGEITVDVSSPILRIDEPNERKKKRKNKNKNKDRS